MPKKKIIILGAGLSGLSAAWYLQSKKIDCRVFEKEPEVGGLCRSKQINGFTFDYDGHLLHFKCSDTYDFVKSLLGSNLAVHKRDAQIFSFNRFIRYPFQANLHGLPPEIIKECLVSFFKSSGNRILKNKKNENFSSWVGRTFGSGIARYFMLPYNVKFWTLPPEKLTCEWLDGFIPVPSAKEIVEGAMGESRRQFGYNANFYYPKRGGIAELPSAMASQVKNIFTNCGVRKIDIKGKYIELSSGEKEHFDYLISSLPLPELARITNGMPESARFQLKKLKWNSIFNLNLGINRKDHLGRHWVYFPQKEICFFRVGFPHNFSSALIPAGKSSLYCEVSYSQGKPIDKTHILSRIKKDLEKTGVLRKSDRVSAQDINDIKYGYPIYDHNYRKARRVILGALSENNIIACGRYGSWQYMSMEDSILDGKKVLEKIS